MAKFLTCVFSICAILFTIDDGTRDIPAAAVMCTLAALWSFMATADDDRKARHGLG